MYENLYISVRTGICKKHFVHTMHNYISVEKIDDMGEGKLTPMSSAM